MVYRKLGETGMEVSEVSLGMWTMDGTREIYARPEVRHRW